MNILDILILAVLGFSLCAGFYKGFLSSFLSTGALVGSWFGARALYERVAAVALNNRTLLGALSNYLEPETFLPGGGTALVSSLSGNVAEIQNIVEAAGKKVPFIKTALENNLLNQSFQNLNLTTVSDYFSETLWEGVFHVIAFVLCFVVIYLLALLVINLIDHVFRFPQLRAVDWLLGGIFGVARGFIFALLLVEIGLPLLSIVQPEFSESLKAGSQCLSLLEGMDLISVSGMIKNLIGA